MLNRKSMVLLAIAIVFISFSMRAPMGGVGPLLGEIRSDLGLSASVAGFITTLPLIIFALSAPIAGILAVRLGSKRLIPISLAIIAFGIFIRSNFSILGLFSGTALIGLGTGFLNVSLPAFIKGSFKDGFGRIMGIYSTSLTFASATIAGVIQPLSNNIGGWSNALLSIGAIVLVALILSIISFSNIEREEQDKGKIQEEKHGIFSLLNLSIAFYMGFQSLIFFSLLSWYPTMMGSMYAININTGILVTIMQASSLIPAYVVPSISNRCNLRILSSCLAWLFVPGILIAGFGSTTFSLIFGTVIAGLSIGSTFSMAITLCAIHGRSGAETARITSFGQFIGYILASIGPTGFGFTYDISSSWIPTIAIMAILAAIMGLLGLYIGKTN